MAIRNGTLKIGEFSNRIYLIDNTYAPRRLLGAHKLNFANASNFKIVDEPNFFGIYHPNATVKSKIYRDLRHQAHEISKTLVTAVQNQFEFVSQNDPQYSAYLVNKMDEKYYSIKKSTPQPQRYDLTNKFYVYTTCHFDDVNVFGKIDFPIKQSSIIFSYTNLVP